MSRNPKPKIHRREVATAAASGVRQLPGVGRQAIEDNPLTDDELAMFEMFERERWSPERRRSHILSLRKR